MNSLTLIGCGNMGLAMLKAIQKSSSFQDYKFLLVETHQEKHKALKDEYRGEVYSSIQEIGEKLNLVIVAVKPKDAESALSVLSAKLDQNSIVISVMAGVSMEKIQSHLNMNSPKIMRVMPNTPCSIQEGMSLLTANEQVTEKENVLVEKMLETLGEVLSVKNEVMIDAGTSISGSGPAYIFYFAENMIKKAVELGFTEEEATKLSLQTLKGATALMQSSEDKPAELRRKVTSRNGTTEAAVNSFIENKIGEHIQEGIGKAFKRAEELR